MKHFNYNGDDFSAWGMPPKEEDEYPEPIESISVTEQINILLDNYLENKNNLNKINKKKALDILAKKINEIK
jgi:hypothetical protein